MLKVRLIVALIIAAFLVTATLNNGESIRGTAMAQHQTTQEPTEQPMAHPFRVKYRLGDFLPAPVTGSDSRVETIHPFACDLYGGFLWIFLERRRNQTTVSTEVHKFYLGGGNAIERIQLGRRGSYGRAVDGVANANGFLVVSNRALVYLGGTRYHGFTIVQFATDGSVVPILHETTSYDTLTIASRYSPTDGIIRSTYADPQVIGVSGFASSDRVIGNVRYYNFTVDLLLASGNAVYSVPFRSSFNYVVASNRYTNSTLDYLSSAAVRLKATNPQGQSVNVVPSQVRGWTTGGGVTWHTLHPNEGTSRNLRARTMLNYRDSTKEFVDGQVLSDVPANSDLIGIAAERVTFMLPAGQGTDTKNRIAVFQYNNTTKEVYYYGAAGTEPPPPPNRNPVFTVSQEVIEVPVNTGTDYVMGHFVATDPDDDTVTLSLGGTDEARFRINSEGFLTAAQVLDTRATYNITVTASDGRTPTAGTAMVSVQIIVGSGLPSDGVLPYRAKYAFSRPTNLLQGRSPDAAHHYVPFAVSLHDNHAWVFANIHVFKTEEPNIRNEIVGWKYPLRGGNMIQEIVFSGVSGSNFADALATDDGFVLLTEGLGGAFGLAFYDTNGTAVNVAGARTTNRITIGSSGVNLDITASNTGQSVEINEPEGLGLAWATFPALSGSVTPAGARVFQFGLLLETGPSFERKMVSCDGTFNPAIRQVSGGQTRNIAERKVLSNRFMLRSSTGDLDPFFYDDWTLSDRGNFGTFHIIYKDQVSRGQNINFVPPRANAILHFSRQRALLGGQRLSQIVMGDTINFVDAELINIAAMGQAANNQTRMLAVDVNHGPVDMTLPTRKEGDLLYYGVEGTGPPPSTTAPGGDNAIKGELAAEDVNRDGAVTVADLILVAALFGQQVPPNTAEDINGDGVVDTADLLAVAQSISPAAPSAAAHIDAATIEGWIAQARLEDDGSLAFKRGIENLLALLRSLIPEETALLRNYPNPFNPETWIPYQLTETADVMLTIYDTKGVVVRQLDLGLKQAGYYTDRARAAYWDGRNEVGEPVASGVYFYQLEAGDYSQTRRMVILK